MIMLEKGSIISDLEDYGMYSLKLKKHLFPVSPLIRGKDLEDKAIELGYYDETGVIEDLEICGPFRNLNGETIDRSRGN